MNPDEFEKRLQRQPLRRIPGEWREQVLRNASATPHSSFVIRHSFLSTLNHKLSAILWPHPKAWAVLAASWMVIMILQLASRDYTHQVAKKLERSSPESVAVLRQQTRLLAELVEQSSPRDTDRPKPNPSQPRSELRTETLIV